MSDFYDLHKKARESIDSRSQGTKQHTGEFSDFLNMHEKAVRGIEAKNTKKQTSYSSSGSNKFNLFSNYVKNYADKVNSFGDMDYKRGTSEDLQKEIDFYAGMEKDIFDRLPEMRKFLDDNRYAIGADYNNLKQYLDDVESSANFSKNLSDMRDFYSSFKSEDDYNQRYGYYKKYDGMTYTDIMDIIPGMEEGIEKEWLSQYAPSVMQPYERDNMIRSNNEEIDRLENLVSEYESIGANYGTTSMEEDQVILSELKQLLKSYGFTNIEDAKNQIENLKASSWNLAQENKYEMLRDNPDFYAKSKDVATAPTAGIGISVGANWFGTGDYIYDFINDLGGKRTKLVKGSNSSPYSKYARMEDDEIDMYNYLYNTQGKDAANEYLDYLEITLDRREMTAYQTNAQLISDKVPFLSSALRVPANLMSGIGALEVSGQKAVKGIQESITGEYSGPVNYNRASMYPSVFSSTVLGTVSQKIADSTGVISLSEKEHPVLSRILNGKSLADVYQLGMSVVDSAAVAAMTAMGVPGGTYLLGGSAATQGILDAVANGATDNQAIFMGLLNGTFEVLFEEYEIDGLLKNISGGTFRNIVAQMLTEGAGEGFTTIANSISDAIVMGANSDWEKNIEKYMADGLSQEEAMKQALLDAVIQVGWDFAGGAVMGGLSTAGGMAIGNVSDALYMNPQRNAENKAMYGDYQQDLVSEAMEINPDNAYAQKLQKFLNEGNDLSGRQITKLVQQNEKAMRSQDMNAIRSAAEARLTALGETGNVSAVASALAKQVSGKKLTKAEQQIISGSKYGIRVANELNTENIASGEYSSAWAERIDTQRINPQEYSRLLKDAQSAQKVAEDTGVQVASKTQKYAQAAQADATQAPVETVQKTRTVSEVESVGDKNTPTGKEGLQAAEDGVTRQASTGKAVTPQKIISISNGTAVIQTDISEISTDDIIFGDKDTDMLWRSAVDFHGINPAGANGIIRAYRSGDSVTTYLSGAGQEYRNGYYNLPSGGQYADKLTPIQREIIYELGQKAAGENTAKAQAKATKAKKAAVSQKENTTSRSGKVHFDRKGRTFDAVRETALKTMEQLSAALGIDFYVYESYKNAAGKRVYKNANGNEVPAPNGYYDTKDGSIHIDLNAGTDGKGTMLFTIAHELTHFIKQWSPAKFKVLANLLINQYREQNVSVNKLVDNQIAKAKKNGRELSWDDAFEEVVADSMEAVLTDGNVVQMMADLKEQDKTLWQKIRDWFRDLAEDLKALLEAYNGYRPDSQEGRMVADMQDVIVILESFYADALADASDNYQAAGAQKNTAQEIGAKYSQRYLAADINSEILAMVNKVANGDFKENEKIYLGTVTDTIADQINELTGIRVNGFKVAIEARQIDHILKGHGVNGDADHSMADPSDIAKMEYVLESPDDIRKAGKTQAYTYMRNGRNRTADTILYEKKIGTKSYYVVQAVPDTKAKTLYVVTAFIGNSGYKKEAPQLINAKGPDATAKTGSVNASTYNIRNEGENVKEKFSLRDTVEETKDLVAVHNMSEEKLIKSLRLGGLPMPSIAILRAQDGHSEFGDISLVFGKDTIDPQAYRSNKLYSGDAYTPTYPKVDYKPSEKVLKKVKDKISGLVPYEVQDALGNLMFDTDNASDNLDRYNGNMVEAYKQNDAMKYAYLKDTGSDISLPMKEADLVRYGEQSNAAVRYFAGKLVNGLQTVEMYQNMGTKELMQDKALMEAVADAQNYDVLRTLEPGSKEYLAYEQDPVFRADEVTFRDIDRFLSASRKLFRNGVQQTVDRNAAREMLKDVDQDAYERWLAELFSGIVEKEGIRNNKDYFTPSGNRRSFEALHYEHNLENVIKAMREKGEKGLGGFGGGNIFGAATTEFSSIEEMKQARDRLQMLPEEEYQKMREDFSTRFFEIARSLPNNKNNWLATDDAANMLVEAVSRYSTKSGIANYIRSESQGWATYSDYVVDDLVELVQEIRNMPTGYFEAKPLRAVGFDEVTTAIVPDSISQDLRANLEEWGIRFVEYAAGDEEARKAALNSIEGVKFSERDSDGNELSQEQQEYFKDSKVRDAQGRLLVMYHGTPNGGFNIFRSGTYFTQNPAYADVYQNPGASSISAKRSADAPMTYKVYLDIQKPFDTRNSTERKIFMDEFYRKYGTGTPLADSGLPDWIDGLDLQEFIEEMEFDYDGLILDEGGVGGYGYDVVSRGFSYVVFDPAQVKNVDNKTPTDDPDIRHSDRDPELEKVNRVLEKQNEKLKDDVSYLKELLRLQNQVTGGTKFTKSSVESAAGQLMKYADAKGNKNELSKLLNSLYEYIANGEDLTWEGVKKAAEPAVEWLQEHKSTKKQLDSYAQEVLQQIRGSRIYLDEIQKKEVAYQYGSFNEFRKKMMGSIIITEKNSISLDSQWHEWSDMFPYIFDADISTNDMPAALLNAFDTLRNMTYENNYAYDEELITQDLLRQVYDSYWNVSTLYTVADKMQKEINKLKYEHISRMSTLRKTHREQTAQLKQEHRDAIQSVRQTERERSEKKLQDISKRYQESLKRWRDRRNNADAIKKYRKQITDTAMEMSEWLRKNSDKEHVPEILKKPVLELLTSIDLSSKRFLNGGELTKADKKFGANLAELQKLLNGQQGAIEGEESAVDNIGAYLDISVENRQFLNDLVNTLASVDGTFTINKMTAEELKSFSKFLSNLATAIRKANKTLANARYQNIPDMAQSSMRHMEEMGNAPASDGTPTAKFLKWSNTTPYYAFKRFGEAGEALFDGFTRGWEKLAFNAQEIIDFTNKTYTAKEIRKWRSDIHDITLENGRKIQMTTAQIMELSQLINREQARKHIEAGGIRIGTIQTKKGPKNDTEHYHFTVNDLRNVVGLLNDRQLKVAEDLRRYMGKRGGEWGNEISMARFGYQFYTEGENYYTIRTDANGRPLRDTDEQTNSMFRLLNLSSSKSLNPNANNALIVSDIFDTFADHMADMAKLNALGLPLLDAIKWYNYTERFNNSDGTMDEEGVKKSMEKAFGTAAGSYFRTLLKDINGVKESGDRGGNFASRMMSNYKVAAVGTNLRVALLQPTSYVRAMYVLNPKNMISALVFKKNAYKEAMKYSGTAVWKSLGYYDTDIAKSMRSQIEHDDTWIDKVKDKSLALAELGDQRTWGRLWVACKLEAKERNNSLSGEALCKATADIFREVIYATQVMDSTLTRSEMMRGSTRWTKLSTAFMAEPTLSLNILGDWVSQFTIDKRKTNFQEAWVKNQGKFALAVTTYVCSATAAALMESIMDAFRDDDDYETFLEKFLQAFIGEEGFLDGNLGQDLTVIGKIPVLKDIISTIRGIKSSDMSLAAITSISNAYAIWKESIALANGTLDKATNVTWYGKMTDWGKIYKSLQALSQLSGLSISNLTRDVVAVWNTIVGAMAPSLKVKTYDPGEKNKIKYAYQDDYLTDEEATALLLENGLVDTEDDAYWTIHGWETGKSKYAAIFDAVLNGGDFNAAIGELTSHGYSEKDVLSQVKSQIGQWYTGGEITKQQAIDMLTKYSDLDSAAITATVNKWSSKVVTGIAYEDIDDEYLAGNITAQRAIEMRMLYGGQSREDAQNTVGEWTFKADYPELDGLITYTQYKRWQTDGQPNGVTLETFTDVAEFRDDGTSSSVKSQEEVAAYIDSLSISIAQKDALWCCFWKESTLNNAPWH